MYSSCFLLLINMPDFYKKSKIFCEFFYMSPFVVFLCTDKSGSIQLCLFANYPPLARAEVGASGQRPSFFLPTKNYVRSLINITNTKRVSNGDSDPRAFNPQTIFCRPEIFHSSLICEGNGKNRNKKKQSRLQPA